MSEALAVTAALFYGFADLAGGYATRRLPVWAVSAWSQLFGVALLVVGLMIVPAESVTTRDLAFGGLAGLAGLFGLVLLYRSLADGTMSVVAPLSGAVAAAIPVVVDVVVGPGLSVRHWIGVGLAFGAVLIVALEHGRGHLDRRALGGALLAGLGFGLFFLAIAQTSPESGLWPLVGARVVSVPLAFAIAAFAGAARVPGRAEIGIFAGVGTLDMAANIAVASALQRGPAGVVAVLSSLYPAVTAATAILLLRERPTRLQLAAMVMALLAVVALVGG